MRSTFVKALLLLILALVAVNGAVFADGDHAGGDDHWTGEVLDLACYLSHGAKGEDHAGCAKTCVKGGQPMGLLTDDGTVYLLAADHKDGAPFEAVKEHAGGRVEVMGKADESSGMKMITVQGSKPAPDAAD